MLFQKTEFHPRLSNSLAKVQAYQRNEEVAEILKKQKRSTSKENFGSLLEKLLAESIPQPKQEESLCQRTGVFQDSGSHFSFLLKNDKIL